MKHLEELAAELRRLPPGVMWRCADVLTSLRPYRDKFDSQLRSDYNSLREQFGSAIAIFRDSLQWGDPFRRLHALIGRGFRPELGHTDTPDVVWLRHPGRGPADSAILYSDGLVVAWRGITRDDGKIRIETDNDARFSEFIRSTPLPTVWQRCWRSVRSGTAFAFAFLFLAAITVGIYFGLKWVERMIW